VRWQGDRRLLFVLNHASELRTVHLDGEYTDLLAAEATVTGAVEMEPYSVRILRS
jgi:beta-galactosidase GanA